MTGAVLEVRGLAKSFGSVRAVKKADFTVRRGTITTFLGPNGAGKTTTLRAVLGFVTKNRGEVVVRASRVGFVPEQPVFFPWLQGLDLVRLTARLVRLLPDELERRMSDLAPQLHFDRGLLPRRAAAYSAGNRKKLAYLLALLTAPDLLIVDEPFSALDPPAIKDVRALFLALRDRGGTLLLSTHLIAEVERICDDFIVIREGVVVAQDNLARFLKTSNLGSEAGLEKVFFLFAG
ncbi:MAG: ABC transporter ATP-binding protein [Candidatus Aminicenantes bacterium]|nr:ABC transporter ATP-binding protein [Candidatus Aminicenantes bacterium]